MKKILAFLILSAACFAQTVVTGAGTSSTVYNVVTTGQTTAPGTYGTVYTTPSAGRYRVSCTAYATTASSAAWVIACDAQATQGTLTSSVQLQQATIGTSASVAGQAPFIYDLAAGATIKIGLFTSSGSNTGGVYTYAVTIEKL